MFSQKSYQIRILQDRNFFMFHNFIGLLEYYLNLDSTHVKIDESQKKKKRYLRETQNQLTSHPLV